MPRVIHQPIKWRVRVINRELVVTVPEEKWEDFDMELRSIVEKYSINTSVVWEHLAEGCGGMVNDPYQERGSFILRANRRELKAGARKEEED